MTIALTPTILRVGNRFLEAYERETNASEEKLAQLLLSSEEPIISTVGVAQIPEFIVLNSKNIFADSIRTWNLSEVNQDLVLRSIFIDNKTADKLNFEIFIDEQRIFYQYFAVNATPHQFPSMPIPAGVTIKVKPKTNIDAISIILQPAFILKTIFAEEDSPSQ